MKKLLALCCVLCLVGCSNGDDKEEIVKVCTLDTEEMHNVATLVGTGDKLLKQTFENTFDYTIQEKSEEEIIEAAENYKKIMDSINGASYEYSINEKELTEKIIIDFEQTDLSTLMEKGLVTGDENATFVSIQKTIDGLEDMNYKCE